VNESGSSVLDANLDDLSGFTARLGRCWRPASGNAGLRGRRAGTARPLRRARGRAARRSRAGPGPCERPSRGLLEVRAETRARAGDLHGAPEDLRAALTLAGTAATRSRLLTRMAVLASGSDDMIRAANLVDLAVVEAADDPAARARALATSAIIDMDLERRARAESRYKEALTLFEQVGDARGVADILDARPWPCSSTATSAPRSTPSTGWRSSLSIPATCCGWSRHDRLVDMLVVAGRPREGLADTEAALDLSRSLGYPEGEAMVLWQNSEALTALGRTAEAKHAAANAVSIAERSVAVAGRPRRCAPSVSRTRPPAPANRRGRVPPVRSTRAASAAVFVLGTCATCPRTGGHGEARGGRHSCRSRACHGATSRPVRSTGRQMRARRRPSATEHLRDAPGCGAPRDRGRPSGQPGPSLHVDRFLGGGLEHSHSRRSMTRWTACLRARWCKLWHRCPRRTVRPPPCKAAPRQ
jgi:tetratricopeptide (TPR) repeat protein